MGILYCIINQKELKLYGLHLVLLLHSAEWFGFKGRKDIAPPVTNRKTKREEHCNSISGLSSKKK